MFVYDVNPNTPPSTKKVRRDSIGGKRGDGHRRCQRIRRPDPRNIRIGAPDAGLTAYGGLTGFGVCLREIGVYGAPRGQFWRLKSGAMVVYPMQAQSRLLMDAAAIGEARVFGVEALSADPLFVHLAGGVVPGVDNHVPGSAPMGDCRSRTDGGRARPGARAGRGKTGLCKRQGSGGGGDQDWRRHRGRVQQPGSGRRPLMRSAPAARSWRCTTCEARSGRPGIRFD
jgi:hypothetical protein